MINHVLILRNNPLKFNLNNDTTLNKIINNSKSVLHKLEDNKRELLQNSFSLTRMIFLKNGLIS
jgi:predicted component of type VI protein secretion system